MTRHITGFEAMRLAIAMLLLTLLAACGQAGSLYLPGDPTVASPPSPPPPPAAPANPQNPVAEDPDTKNKKTP
jgi:predicted small lipoprotein YifL